MTIQVDTNIDDNGIKVGPTWDPRTDVHPDEGFFVEKTDATVEEVKTEEPKPAEEKLFAGKFKSPEELEKAYAELQKKLGAPKEEPKADPKEDEKPAEEAAKEGDEKPKDEPKADEALAPIDFAKLTAEFNENGGLTEESQAGLAKLGVTPEVTELFFAGIEAIQTARVSEVHAAAGSADDYKALVEWGKTNLSATEQAAFDAALDKAVLEGDAAGIKLMIPAIKAKMHGDAPNYVQSRPGQGQGSITPFANRSEQNAAINDRRYGRDAAYTAEVERRIEISDF
jgi:hypothetical protein